MTFTKKEIKEAKLTIDYADEWMFNDERKMIDVKFYGLEQFMRRFFNLDDDYGEDWIDCYATINPVEGYVTDIYIDFISNCDQNIVPDRELQIKITNLPEGKMLLNEMLENDKKFGGFIQFIEDARKEYSDENME